MEEIKRVFRVYRGEDVCPYTEETVEQRHLNLAWRVEQILAKTAIEDIVRKYDAAIELVPKEIKDAEATEAEKACAYFVYIASDTMMSEEGMSKYLAMPIVYETK